MKRITYLLLFFVLLATKTYSQQDSTQKEDTFFDDKLAFPSTSKSIFSKSDHSHTVELQYGYATASIHESKFNLRKFRPANSAFIKWGSRSINPTDDSSVFEYGLKSIKLGKFSSEWFEGTDSKRIGIDTWMFGFGSSSGYGYKFGEKSDLVLYRESAINWSWTDFKGSIDTTTVSDPVQKAKAVRQNSDLGIIHDGGRFGSSEETGIKFQIYKPLAVNIGVERNEIYPRTMFWYMCGSSIVKGVGTMLIKQLGEMLFESSPKILPIFDWVVQTAYSYGFSQLTRKHMEWPIYTVPPLIYDNYKFGLTFNF